MQQAFIMYNYQYRNAAGPVRSSQAGRQVEIRQEKAEQTQAKRQTGSVVAVTSK